MKKKVIQNWFIHPLVFCAICLIYSGCEKAEPTVENTPETITTTRLIFAPVLGGNVYVYQAVDPDGDGPENAIIEDVVLDPNTPYLLSIEVFNEMLGPKDDGYDITMEIKKENKAHQFFFGGTGDIFTDPPNADIQKNKEEINYQDRDENELPLGMETLWVTNDAGKSGTLRIVLKHQPTIKSENTGVDDGASDFDYIFNISVE